MSKTVSTCLLETNQVQGKPQENVFFHSLYRTEPEFVSEFFRVARSTSPIQICAIFSTVGPDSLAAILNIELNKELAAIVEETNKQPVLDFDNFSKKVVNTLNSKVCSYIVAKGGTPLKTSMTMMVVEGDILRVIHIGNTKAVLYRDKKIMALTEEQTVAHRYVQMGAIKPEEEKNHPEKDTLTQYLGKMPQDGELIPEKKVNIKLKDNDELYLMGNGISKAIPQQMRNMVICKDISTEEKAREIIIAAVNYGVKYGLSLVAMKVESTLLLPGDAVLASATADKPAPVKKDDVKDDVFAAFNEPKDDDEGNTTTFAYKGNSSVDSIVPDEPAPNKKKAILIDVAIVLGILLLFIGIGFGGSYLFMVKKGWISTVETTLPTMVQTVAEESVDIDTNAYYEEQHILYAIDVENSVKAYEKNDQTSAVIAELKVNEPVTVLGEDETGLFYYVTIDGVNGYILKPLLSEYETEITTPTTQETAQTSIPRGGEPTVPNTPPTAARTTAPAETTPTTTAPTAAPTEPAPTEPAPTEPAPVEPAPGGGEEG
ncbi:MAG: hypothetical protein MJ108_03740 [Saccharofermentans sp.]|nr:hypothetical protein [Saccharofermentans sp.]